MTATTFGTLHETLISLTEAKRELASLTREIELAVQAMVAEPAGGHESKARAAIKRMQDITGT